MEEKNLSSEIEIEEATPNKNAAAIRQYLDTEDGRKRKKRRGSGTMAGRQTVLIALLLSLLLVGGILYFTVIKPLSENHGNEPGQKEELTLLEGESKTEYGALTMYEAVKMDAIKELQIENENDTWSFVYDEKNGVYHIKDYLKTYSICDTSTWTTLVYQFGTAQVQSRVEDGSSPIDYAKYGLGEGDTTRSCTVTTKDGHVRTVTVGAQTATGSGYYATATIDGVRREAVYIISTSLASCTSLSKLDLISPLVTIPFDEEDYVPDRLVIRHEGQPFVDVRLLTEHEAAQMESPKTTHVITANGMEYNASVGYSTMLYNVLRKGVNGVKVVAISKDDETMSAEELAKWGIDLSSGSPYIDLYIEKSSLLNQNLIFSPKTKDGTYYVYVMIFDMVVEMDASAMEFIEWPEKDFIEASIYLMSVYNITELTVDSTALPDAYVKSGVPRVKETFFLTSKRTTAADKTETYVLTDVKVASTGKTVPDPKNSKLDGIANFKHYYMVLMTIGAQLDIPADIRDQLDMSSPDVTITVRTVLEQEHILRFYFYNSRHAYYTLDGEGQFYVVYDELTKFLADTVSVVNGEYVDWESKNNENVDVDPESGEGDVKPVKPVKPDEQEEKLPASVVTIIVIAALLVVGGVGGFGIYAAVQHKKKEEEAAER